jgi:hypothetical protein
MLADELDSVIGVDTHRDAHALVVLAARSSGMVAEAQVVATASGYAAALALAEGCAAARRAWAIEASGCYEIRRLVEQLAPQLLAEPGVRVTQPHSS